MRTEKLVNMPPNVNAQDGRTHRAMLAIWMSYRRSTCPSFAMSDMTATFTPVIHASATTLPDQVAVAKFGYMYRKRKEAILGAWTIAMKGTGDFLTHEHYDRRGSQASESPYQPEAVFLSTKQTSRMGGYEAGTGTELLAAFRIVCPITCRNEYTP